MKQRAGSCVAFALLAGSIPAIAYGQTATYHLHKEGSRTPGLFQLKVAAPDTNAASAVADMKNQPVNEYLVKAFDTQAGVPSATGTIPAGSIVSFRVWMRKTVNAGTMYPRAKVKLNSATGPSLCAATGTNAITTTITTYSLNCTTATNIPMAAADRFYLWVGINLTASGGGTSVKAELDIEGVLNGHYDSQVVIPLPILPPAISSLSPASGSAGTAITVAGSNFAATQGSSTVTFNGVAATPTAWSATSITVPAPAGVTTGPVVVTVSGLASNGVAFTASPRITALGPTSGPAGSVVTIAGSNFGSAQGSSSIAFNGIVATPTAWSATGITAPVPAAATTGAVIVTVSGLASNGVTFAVEPAISNLAPPSGLPGTVVTISGTTFGAVQGTSVVTFDGVTATPASWSATSITAAVPARATTGNVVVTVNGLASNGAPFVVTPAITSLSPASGREGAAITISGSNFGSTKGNSSVTFNGVPATPAVWSNTRILATVPPGATSGNVVVTVSNSPSRGTTFIVVVPGSIAGTVTRLTGGTPIAGATVDAVSGMFAGSAITTADGSYSILSLDPGTYDVRVVASGFSAERRQAVTVVPLIATPLNLAMSMPGTVSGKVLQADGAIPIAGGAVAVFAGSGQVASTSTNSTGDYTIASLHPGSYTVQAASVGYRTGEQAVHIEEAAVSPANFSLDGAAAGPVLYAYDAVGRLIQVTDPAGDFAIYHYDAVGNITAIDRPQGAGVAIGGFTPTAGAPGTTVTIYGGGFSAAPAENVVSFNGIAASIEAATATQLTAVVPSGATTGPISITTSTDSATSRQLFTVSTNGAPPTITTFIPTIGTAGTAITVSGTNFDPAVLNNRVDLNGRTATVVSGSAATLATTVPAFAMGGHMSVATPFGAAVSASDFFVAPSPYVAADVFSTDRMTLGTSKAITIGVSGKIALVLFDGTAGQHISFSVSNSTIASGSITIYRPDGVQVAAGSTASNTFIDSQTFPLTGSYTIVVDPASTYTGGLTLTTYAVDDVTGSIDADGTTVPVTITTPGQNGRFTFSGTAGQLISAWTTSGTWVSCIYDQYYVSIVNPDGSTLVRVFQCGSGALIDQQTLPLTGIYTLMVDPVGANTGTATLRLYTFADVTGPITSDGTDVAVTIAAPGQNARFTFTGAAGQVVSTWVTSGTWVACSVDQYYLSIVSPDGSRLARVSQCGSSAFIDQKTLPVAGTYTLVLDPVGANTGSATIHLFTVVDVTGPIAADGTSAPVSISVPGQNARLTFTGVAGQVVSAWVTSGTWLACSVDQYYVSIVSPDGSTLARVSQCGSSAFIDQKTLPVGGTYTLVLDPVSANVGSATLRLYTVVDIAGPITANGSSVFFSIATPGQNALLTFDGTAGQVVTASVTSSWTGCVVDQFFLELWKPDGSKLASAFDCGGGASLNNKTLPASGVYTVRFNPVGANTGSATVTLRSP